MNKKQWMPLLGMTIAAFIFNTSEFMQLAYLPILPKLFQLLKHKQVQ